MTRTELKPSRVDLSELAGGVIARLASTERQREVTWTVTEGLFALLDPALALTLLDNLLGNAWKFTSKVGVARIEFGASMTDGQRCFFVRDNGAGFDMEYASKLFAPFQRLHTADEFAGTGIGLATAQRIVTRHGGRIWAEGIPDKGATFFFTLSMPRQESPP